ncbi:MAG: peptidoglycan-binding domain-containing protein [Candidatus Sericytochromatia bacterium]
MVNVNNVSVGQTYNTGEVTNKQSQNQGQVNAAQENQPQFKKDGVSINNQKSGPVPDVKVGFFDRMMLKTKDVYQSDENIQKYVVFQKSMEMNPDGYLQAGTTDVTKTTDLQKKLKLMGYNITVNGKFGDATEKAVVDFKRTVGVNDGFLTKNGQISYSSIVTPETWRVLNSNVSSRLNPNENITQGTYIPAVTQDEINWAKNLSEKVSKFGYPPTKDESVKYESIRNRMNMANQVRSNLGLEQQAASNAPTQADLDWAKNFLSAVKSGHKPTQAESAKYNEIRAKQQAAKNQPSSGQIQQLTQQDIDWAKSFAEMVKAGHNPTKAEEAKYNRILQLTTQMQTQPKEEKIELTEENIAWAKDLAAKVSKGYEPTPAEEAKYNKIIELAKQQKAEETKAPEKVDKPSVAIGNGPVSKEEFAWALDLQNKISTQNYKPNKEEAIRFNNIFDRVQMFGEPKSENVEETQGPKKPAQVENKDPNHGNTVEVFGKVGSAMNDWKKSHPSTPFPREHVFYAAVGGNLVSQMIVNDAAKNNKNYVGELGLVGAKAIYAPNLDPAQAGNYIFANGKIYNKESVDNTVDLRVDNASKPKPAPKKQTQPKAEENLETQAPVETNKPSKTGNITPPTREELLWAQDLENKVNNQKYEATPEESAKYDDIYNRAQALSGNSGNTQQPVDVQQVQQNTNKTDNSGNVSINPDPNNQELTWALQLLDKIQQGYTPKPEEIDAYEKIIAKNTQVPYTP